MTLLARIECSPLLRILIVAYKHIPLVLIQCLCLIAHLVHVDAYSCTIQYIAPLEGVHV